MHPEVAFLGGYASVLVLVATGLDRLGRRPSSAWASRPLAAGRPPGWRSAAEEPGWPHTEVPGFYHGVSLVVLAAGMVLAGAGLGRHHDPVEVALLGAVLVVAAIQARRLVGRHRAARRR